MQVYADTIKAIDATADVRLVMDIADEIYRFFGEMSEADWRECVALSKDSEMQSAFAA